MPRLPRQKSKTGIYHIIMRGTNKQVIFHDDGDYAKFLEKLFCYKEKTKTEVYAWCLMSNHLHLLIKEGEEEISATMKRLGISYAMYFNAKYRLTGPLFQGRFRSEKVESDEYLMTVVRYIHQNPVKAGISKRPSGWEWSSCAGYYGREDLPPHLLDKDYLLKIFSEDRTAAVRRFKEFNESRNSDKCMEDSTVIKLTDREAKEEIKKLLQDVEIMRIRNLPKCERDEILRKLKKIEGISQRQIARMTGVSQTLVSNSGQITAGIK